MEEVRADIPDIGEKIEDLKKEICQITGTVPYTYGDLMDDPEAVREAILSQAEKLAAEGIPEKNFRRMKRSAFGRRIRGLDSFDSTCFRICAYHFSGFDYFRFPEVYRSIEAKEIAAFLGTVVKRERCSLSVINPLKEETK